MQHKQQTLSVRVPALVAPTAVTVPDAVTEQPFIEAALRRPAPRRVCYSVGVRLWRIFLLNSLLVCLAGYYAFLTLHGAGYLVGYFLGLSESCAIAILMRLVIESRLRRQARLLRDGVAVTGTIVAVAPKEDWRLDAVKITYRFSLLDGEERTHALRFPSAFAAQYAPGQTLTILYNPARPDESFPYAAITDAVIE